MGKIVYKNAQLDTKFNKFKNNLYSIVDFYSSI